MCSGFTETKAYTGCAGADAANLSDVSMQEHGFFLADCNGCFCAGIHVAVSSVLNMTCRQMGDWTTYTILDRPTSVGCSYSYSNGTVSSISFVTRHNLQFYCWYLIYTRLCFC